MISSLLLFSDSSISGDIASRVVILPDHNLLLEGNRCQEKSENAHLCILSHATPWQNTLFHSLMPAHRLYRLSNDNFAAIRLHGSKC
jgi:hypothetical protein